MYDLNQEDVTHATHATPGHWHQLCELFSRSKLAVKSYGLDMNFRYVHTVTVAIEIWLIQGHDTLSVHGK